MKKACAFKTIQNIYWDNWGRYVVAFPKGGVYIGTVHYNDSGEIQAITARSPIYDVKDDVDMECIEILEIKEEL
ncbi:hypothetical protein O0555_20975 [Brevibacillus laterosporus]|uniref:hypothetical protein n=1 Tax=Brevibacillus laterosporus TaxID=1465 RepID=UPI00215D5C03|nr:hypothetical protein [Brevibacillus laterosporus]MCR8939776.1 hypothetical protein [Brevibacillus laterosporus]MCZ0842416.1 hypothetical protein [Brevibacillus laterosporus]MCZ0846413.1 hypothetical protein [Brevibacillus laterosporus]